MDKVLFSRKSDEWSTPRDLFDKLNSVYHFTLDPCSSHSNALCDKHYTLSEDGLLCDWSNEVVFCNPPYSNIRAWVQKAIDSKAPCVMLVPARTDTSWFHDLVYTKFPVDFIKGRLRFSGSHNSAPFPSMLIYFYI